jgi:hypothetical protein
MDVVVIIYDNNCIDKVDILFKDVSIDLLENLKNIYKRYSDNKEKRKMNSKEIKIVDTESITYKVRNNLIPKSVNVNGSSSIDNGYIMCNGNFGSPICNGNTYSSNYSYAAPNTMTGKNSLLYML